MQEIWVQSLSQEDLPGEGTASIPVFSVSESLQIEEPYMSMSMGCKLFKFTYNCSTNRNVKQKFVFEFWQSTTADINNHQNTGSSDKCMNGSSVVTKIPQAALLFK